MEWNVEWKKTINWNICVGSSILNSSGKPCYQKRNYHIIEIRNKAAGSAALKGFSKYVEGLVNKTAANLTFNCIHTHFWLKKLSRKYPQLIKIFKNEKLFL